MSFRIPYLRGNMKFRDHVHWRMADISLRTSDEEKTHPAGFTLDQFLKMSWRVKKWKLNGDYSHSFSFTYPGFAGYPVTRATGTYSINVADGFSTLKKFDPLVDGSPGSPPTRTISDMTSERQLMDFANPKLREFKFQTIGMSTGYFETDPPNYEVNSPPDLLYPVGGNSGLRQRWAGWDGSAIDTSVITHSISGSIPSPGAAIYTSNFSDTASFPVANLELLDEQPVIDGTGLPPQKQVFYDSDTELFYPYVLFEVANHGTRISTGLPGQTIYYDPTSPTTIEFGERVTCSTVQVTGSEPSIGNLTIFGVDIPIYLITNLASSGFTPLVNPTGNAGNFTLEPDEWFTFKTKGGLDVFNSTTGDLENDAFS